jgi:squalene synthase HpnC
MTGTEAHASGKDATQENFPVASALIARRYRAPVMAYYRFARAADDVADHPALPEAEKLRLLDRLEATLLGRSDEDPAALPLRAQLAGRDLAPTHALDLLTAFRRDVTKRRYADWAELMDYCRYSAMPVGRFVLDVHGESRATLPANDALCAALQIINHLQDCAKDYRQIDRVYLPLDALAAAGASVEDLGAARSSPALTACLHGLTRRTLALLDEVPKLSLQVRDTRLGVETGVIDALARTLIGRLLRHDPLSERVHLTKAQAALTAAGAVVTTLLRRLGTSAARPAVPRGVR